MQLADVEASIIEDDLSKRDITVPAERVLVREDGGIWIADETGLGYVLEPTDWALTQLMQRTGLPVRYGKKIPKWLMAENLNHGLSEYGKDLFIRTRGDALRAVLSEKYRPFDNSRVVEALGNILPGQVDFEIERMWLDDRGLMVNVVFPEMAYDVGDGYSKPDIMKVGVLVGNSEIGARSVFAIPRLLRQVCTNGLVAWVAEGDGFSMPHMGHGPWEMEEGLAKAIANSAQVGHDALDKVRESIKQEISKPLAIIEKLAEKGGMSKKFSDEAKTSLESDTAWGVINSFTSTAKRIENAERRIEIEQFAGFLLEHPELMDLSNLEKIEEIKISGSEKDQEQ